MDWILVRHAEPLAPAGHMLGRLDPPLSVTGASQAALLGRWLERHSFGVTAAYTSPLLRARQTAEALADEGAAPTPTIEPLLTEVAGGSLEGLSGDAVAARAPSYLTRGLTELADFAEYGGESYEQVQSRVAELRARLEQAHGDADCVLLVGHSGFNFHVLKQLVCLPVPRVCLVGMGYCSASRVHVRERRGVRVGELAWHVPIELMGGEAADGRATLLA